ncbi:S8 family peptidase [Calidithermus chliarophilus]|uniref:S8 family peptidase n=1 Tax=Calidithermus chliarophilus TaxID=52023 RepID=UPI000402A62C|nr:S8 family serine peptidase [Calidithermus chliarophilus]
MRKGFIAVLLWLAAVAWAQTPYPRLDLGPETGISVLFKATATPCDLARLLGGLERQGIRARVLEFHRTLNPFREGRTAPNELYQRVEREVLGGAVAAETLRRCEAVPPPGPGLAAPAELGPCEGAFALLEVDGVRLNEAIARIAQNDFVLAVDDSHSSGWTDAPALVQAPPDYREAVGWRPGLEGGAGAGVTVAVLDTGVTDGVLDNFGSRLLPGFDFVSNDPDAREVPGNGGALHGTPVAALIAGERSGLAPRARVLPVRVCDEKGLCRASHLIRGTCWALSRVSSGGRDLRALRTLVLNYSLGSPKPIEPLRVLLAFALQKNALAAASAGNDGAQGYGALPHFPAHYAPELEGLLGVAALQPSPYEPGTWERMPSSTAGPHVEISAPGLTALAAYGGTSFATACVTGALALWRNACPDLVPASVELKLRARATRDPLSGLVFRQLVGDGMLDLRAGFNCDPGAP